jgi:putative flippase GtrA
MDVNDLVTIGIAGIVGVRVAMVWTSRHNKKVTSSEGTAGDVKRDEAASKIGENSSETLGQERSSWGLSNKDGTISRKLMRTELIGYVINEILLVVLTSVGIYYLYASLVAAETGLVAKFFANDLLTFKDRQSGHRSVRLLKFNLVGLIGIGINLTGLYLATTFLHLPYSDGNLLGMAASIPLYFIHVRFTWKKTGNNNGEEQKSILASSENP